jgi:hypothetical protein
VQDENHRSVAIVHIHSATVRLNSNRVIKADPGDSMVSKSGTGSVVSGSSPHSPICVSITPQMSEQSPFSTGSL